MGIRRDDVGQMHTIEAVLAVGMMIAALYITMTFTPVDVTPRQDFAEVQLKNYGRDVLTLLSHPYPGIAGGHLEYELYREHNLTKWRHDVGTNVTPKQRDIKAANMSHGLNWTDEFLHIGHDVRNETLTVRFLLFDRTDGRWKDPSKTPGRLEIRTVPAPSGLVVSNSTTDNFTFRHDTGGGRNYTLNIIWFQHGANVSKPILVWVDMHPVNYNARMAILGLRGEDKLWNSTEMGQGGSITVWKDPGVKGNRWALNDKGITDTPGVSVTDLGNNEFRFTFNEPAKGGYALYWITGTAFPTIHAGPVYVTVGEPGIEVMPGVGLALSPLEASVGPGGVGYLFSEVEKILRAYLPENVGWNLYVLDANGTVAYNWERRRMEIVNGIPAPGAVMVDRPVFSTVDGSTYDVYMAKLVLWYK